MKAAILLLFPLLRRSAAPIDPDNETRRSNGGPVSFNLDVVGYDMKVTAVTGASSKTSCDGKFVDFLLR